MKFFKIWAEVYPFRTSFTRVKHVLVIECRTELSWTENPEINKKFVQTASGDDIIASRDLRLIRI